MVELENRFPPALIVQAEAVLEQCRRAGIMVATAESCTGGLIAALLTEVPGSSNVVDRGFVTYSNAAKMTMLGVQLETLETHGAVSEETALEMARGALAASDAALAVSVTGIAGPGGGTADKPVGLVCFGIARVSSTAKTLRMDYGPKMRSAIRTQSVQTALSLIETAVGSR